MGGPEASPANYTYMGTAGYLDEVIACAVGEESSIITWDPKNPLNSVGPHASSPPQRCDHLFCHEDSGLIGTSVKLMFTEALVQTPQEPSTMSDHYGLLVHLQLKSSCV